MTLALGLDIGSTTTKAAIVDVTDDARAVRGFDDARVVHVSGDARVVHVSRRPTPTDTGDLIATAAAVARECLAAADGPVAAIGVASMAESGAALDASGRALTPLLRWDRRVDRAHLARLLAQHPDLPAVTGIPATTKPAAVALTALRAEQPEIFEAMAHWAGVADLVAHALTGVRAIDHTLAVRTMIAGADGEAWDADVLDGLALAASVLPEIRLPGEPVGTTIAGAGLPGGIPVFIAGHDHAVGAWGAGVRAPGAVADSLGTSEAVVRVADAVDRPHAVASGFAVGRTVDGTATTILGGSPACGAMLEWWEREHPSDAPLATLAALAADDFAAAEGIVLPYPNGRQCPAPDASAGIVLLNLPAERGARVRSLLQSLVFHARWMRETADLHAGAPSTEITLLGSLAERIPVWGPLTAAAGIPTSASESSEPVAAGAAILAAARAGVAPAASLPRHAVAAVTTPDLDDAYRRFLQAVPSQDRSPGPARVTATAPIQATSQGVQ